MTATGSGRVALVTGATGGIGSATARRLAAAGYRVAVHTAHHAREAQTLAASLPGDGHCAVHADLGQAGAASAVVAEVIERSGRLDVLVNNAGVYVAHDPHSVEGEAWREAWRRTLAVNLIAPADLIFASLQHLPHGGKIINVSSRGAYRGEPEAPAYGASKAGLNSLTQSMAKALGPRGVLVYGVAPGWVATEMAEPYLSSPEGEDIRAQSPLGRVARPEEVAATIAFLAGDDTDYLSGAIIDVNGASWFR